jgi:hypothetical protein
MTAQDFVEPQPAAGNGCPAADSGHSLKEEMAFGWIV